jgi:hypothetical protein
MGTGLGALRARFWFLVSRFRLRPFSPYYVGQVSFRVDGFSTGTTNGAVIRGHARFARVSRIWFLVSRFSFGVWRLAFGAGLQPGRAKIYLSREELLGK